MRVDINRHGSRATSACGARHVATVSRPAEVDSAFAMAPTQQHKLVAPLARRRTQLMEKGKTEFLQYERVTASCTAVINFRGSTHTVL